VSYHMSKKFEKADREILQQGQEPEWALKGKTSNQSSGSTTGNLFIHLVGSLAQ
jgi:hypothetical protein